MEIRVLGCHGSQLPGCGFTGFLIDGVTLLDAGATTSVLTLEEQARIDHVLISHAHLDHIRELPSLADNLCYTRKGNPLRVISMSPVIDALKQHIFNGVVWPDFSMLPDSVNPVLRFEPISPGETMSISHLHVTAIPVHHAVGSLAYLIEAGQGTETKTAVFVGDTGPTEEIWSVARRGKNVRAIFVETSFPDKMAEMADLTGHLTPTALARELEKISPLTPQIYLYHLKVQYGNEIRHEIESLKNARLHFLRDGQVVKI